MTATPLVSIWAGNPILKEDGFIYHSHWITHRSARAWKGDQNMPGRLTHCILACDQENVTSARQPPLTVIEQTPSLKPLTTLEEVVKQSPRAIRRLCPICFPLMEGAVL